MSGSDGLAKIWNVLTAEERLFTGHEGEVRSTAFRPPDGQQVATAGNDGTVRLWESATGKLLYTWQPHAKAIATLAFNRNGTQLVTASKDGSAKIWQIGVEQAKDRSDKVWQATLVKEFPTGGQLYHAIFAPDQEHVVTANANGIIHFWSLKTCQRITCAFQAWFLKTDQLYLHSFAQGTFLQLLNFDRDWAINAHAGPVHYSEFSPDGKLLATAGADGRAILWDLAQRRPQSVLTGNMDHANDAHFSPDGRLLATAGDDGTVRFYFVDPIELADFAQERIKRKWTPEECKQYLQPNQCLDIQ